MEGLAAIVMVERMVRREEIVERGMVRLKLSMDLGRTTVGGKSKG